MPTLQIVSLVLFVILLAVLLIRYVHMTVDEEFRHLARASTDPEYRDAELVRVDGLLAAIEPPPPDHRADARRPSGIWRTVAPILMFLGVALLWGALFSREGRGQWFWGGIVSCALSGAIMLVTLRQRKWDRYARLRRYRADLRRMAGDREGAAADLRELLRVTPGDDAAWSELSDDLAASGKTAEAYDAIREAARLDPNYEDYRMLETSLAIRLGKYDDAREALRRWSEVERVVSDDPRLAVYGAAIDLAEGRRDAAAESIRRAMADDDAPPPEFLDEDEALKGVRALLLR